MKMLAILAVVLLAVSVIGLAAFPAGAVTWLTVNGATGGTVSGNMPGSIVFRCDTSTAGATVHFLMGADLNGNGRFDAGETVFGTWIARDTGWMDEDASQKIVQATSYPVDSAGIRGGPILMAAVDEDGSVVAHTYSMDYTHLGQSISGRLRWDDGTPGAGLAVAAGAEGTLQPWCITDAAGNYTLYVPAGLHVLRVAVDWGVLGLLESAYVPTVAWVNVGLGEAKTGVNFTLHVASGPRIKGTVTEGDTGHPISGIQVEAHNESTDDLVDARTDIDGNYVLQLCPGTWQVEAKMINSITGAYPYDSPASGDIILGSSDVTINFECPRLSDRIYGIVTGPGGTIIYPVGGHAVSEYDHEDYMGDCNNQGHYEMWLPAGTYSVWGQDSSWDHANYQGSDSIEVTLPPNAQRADFSLAAYSYTLSGRVTFSGTATGVPYAQVTLNNMYGPVAMTVSDGRGYYSVKVPSGTYDANASSWLFETGAGPVSVTFGPSRTLNFSLTPTHSAPGLSAGGVSPASGGIAGQTFTFTATYTSADNTPPAQVYVVIDSWPRPMMPANPGDTNYVDGAVYQCQTALPMGTHTYWFGALDGNWLDARFPASTTRQVVVGDSGHIKGQVKRRSDNANVAGAVVTAYLGGEIQAATITNANGVYSLDTNLPTGTYVLVASTSALTQTKANISVTQGATTYVNFLLDPVCLKGQVKVAGTGATIAGAMVEAYQGAVRKGMALTDSKGVYQIGGLAAGSYTVVGSKAGYVRQSKPSIAVAAGSITYVNFSLAVSGKLKGQVKDKVSTLPIQGATVVARMGGVERARATTDSKGLYEIASDVPAGTYVVGASMTGYLGQTRKDIPVTAGATTYVNFSLASGG